MGIAEGISLGLFIVFEGIVIWFFIMAIWILVDQLVDYNRGKVTFMELSAVAQWIVLNFFNDDGDGFA